MCEHDDKPDIAQIKDDNIPAPTPDSADGKDEITESSQTAEGNAQSQRRTPFLQKDGLLLLGIILLALIVRLVYLVQLRDNPLFDHPTLDAKLHYDWAKAILAGEHLFEGAYFRAPLYPWFLSLIYAITGPGFLAPRIVQMVLGAMSCGLMYLIGRDAFGKATGIIAGLAGATYWVLIYYDGELLLEPISIFLNLLSMWLLLRAGRSSTWLGWAAAGVVLGLSAINRPNVLALMPFLALWIIILYRRQLASGLGRAALFGIACAIPILPITIRNYVVGDDFVLIASQGGANFYIGNNPLADGQSPLMPGSRRTWTGGCDDWTALAEAEEGRRLKPSEVSEHYFQKAFAFMRDTPGLAAKLMYKKLWCFFNEFEYPNVQNIYFFTNQYTPIVRYLPLTFAIVAPLGIVGLWLSRRETAKLFPLSGFLIIYSATVIAFFVNARFRIPVVPFFLIFGAFAVVRLADLLRKKEWRGLCECGIALAILWTVIHKEVPQKAYDDPRGFCQVGSALLEAGEPTEAAQAFQAALGLEPSNAEALAGMGYVGLAEGRVDEGIKHFLAALEADPSYDAYEATLTSLFSQGRYRDIVQVIRRGLKATPGNVELQLKLAYFLAVAPDAQLRDGPEAVRITENLQRLGCRSSVCYHTLALAYAEVGKFEDAVRMADCAMRAASESGRQAEANVIAAHKRLFQQQKPFHLPQGRITP